MGLDFRFDPADGSRADLDLFWKGALFHFRVDRRFAVARPYEDGWQSQDARATVGISRTIKCRGFDGFHNIILGLN